ncbi:MAG: MerR family transcriptional regulator [Dehalococcoidia bacterium]
MTRFEDSIAKASAALELHPQTLRKYERAGLVRPARQSGARAYSQADLDRIALIKHLSDVRRLNIAGLALALDVLDGLEALLTDLDTLDGPSGHAVARERVTAIVARFRQ